MENTIFKTKHFFKTELEKKDEELRSIKEELEKLRRENRHLSSKNSSLKTENEALEETVKELTPLSEADVEGINNELQMYYEKYESTYCDLGLPNATFDYARLCFSSPLGLGYFDPIKYQKNSVYRKLIDLNAERLIHTYKEYTNLLNVAGLQSARFLNMGRAYNELMQNLDSDFSDSNVSLTDERRELEKLDLNY
ncbi:hypothetical protein [Butyrivibrio sp. YAB3001]|uniref:hypothetical protein n=1 Tax=Butyrivibrio sp. YAB3001 TaxID=1520812 RepID=UPI0008F632A9|nr:hypothetical protein [Butyrivibrio sp. YAB3001]SFC42067.1 hypothetical protein SAMN02910398_02217 [Butyrivibrio sp. YAB3001]